MIQIIYLLRVPTQAQQLEMLCRQSGLSCKAFQPADAGKAVATLLHPGLLIKTAKTSVPLLWQAPEFILMSGLPRPQMETFLDACSELGISRNILKAMVTPINATWTVYDLLNQLQSEHNTLQRRT